MHNRLAMQCLAGTWVVVGPPMCRCASAGHVLCACLRDQVCDSLTDGEPSIYSLRCESYLFLLLFLCMLSACPYRGMPDVCCPCRCSAAQLCQQMVAWW
jgi:hypothetical protein